MGVYYLQNCKLYVAQYDFTGDTNQITVSHEAAELDNTNFASGGTRSRIAGLEKVALSHEGFWNGGANNVDDAMFARLAGARAPVTVGPESGLIGERAFLFRGSHFAYELGGAVGEIMPITGSVLGSSKLVRGTVLSDASAARTSTFTSTAQQVGVVGATQKLYAALHVIAASGTTPTLDVVVQSDNGAGFGSPANQITFTQATARTSAWAAPVSGAITDDWWRISATIGGTSPSFTFIVSIGIK